MPTLSELRGTFREQVNRRVASLSRPVRILKALPEYATRVHAARAAADDRYDAPGLDREGYGRLQLDAGVLAPLLAASRAKLAAAKDLPARGAKAFFSQLLAEDDLALDGPFLRAALDPKLLGTVARYLACAPFLESVELLYSRPSTEPLNRSQLWHMDMTEASCLKLFVYADDVTEANGPFTLLSKPSSRAVPGWVPHYIEDAELARHVPPSEIVRIEGPAGSGFLVDTRRCYHCGSRCREPRLAFVAYYTSGFGYYDRMRSWGRVRGLPALQALALGQL